MAKKTKKMHMAPTEVTVLAIRTPMKNTLQRLLYALLLICFFSSCKKEDAAPVLTLLSIKSGDIELSPSTITTKVSTVGTIVLTFSTNVDVPSSYSSIKLYKGDIEVSPQTTCMETVLLVSPGFEYDTEYKLSITNTLKSDKGVAISNPTTVQFKTEEAHLFPSFEVDSVKTGGFSLLNTGQGSQFPVNFPIVVTFTSPVDAVTATQEAISLTRNSIPVAISISVKSNSLRVTPISVLNYNTEYLFAVKSSLKSIYGVPLASARSVRFLTDDPQKVFINLVVASPTSSEAVVLKNSSGSDQDISNWTLGDSNDPVAYKIPSGTILKNGQTKIFSHETIGFEINDAGEVIYLKNSAGVEIDKWSN